MKKLSIVGQEDIISRGDRRLMIEIIGKEIRFGFFNIGETQGRLIATAMKVPSGRVLIYAVPGMEHYGFAKYPGGPKSKPASDLTPARIKRGDKNLVGKYFSFLPKDTIYYVSSPSGNIILK